MFKRYNEDTKRDRFDIINLRKFPNKFDLESLDYFLTTNQEDLHARFKQEFVLESSKFILKNNKLTFDSEFYLQIKRRVIIFVPIYTYSITNNHEVNVYSITRQSYAVPSKYSESSWLRFLGDCQLLMKFNLKKPDHFFRY